MSREFCKFGLKSEITLDPTFAHAMQMLQPRSAVSLHDVYLCIFEFRASPGNRTDGAALGGLSQ